MLILAATLALAIAGLATSAQAREIRPLTSNIAQEDASASLSQQSQAFSTGGNAHGYVLESVGLFLGAAAGADIGVRIFSTDDFGRPDRALFALTAPASLAKYSLNRFRAPADARLSDRTTYAVVVTGADERFGPGNIGVMRTASTAEESGADPEWSIADTRYWRNWSRDNWTASTSLRMKVEIAGSVRTFADTEELSDSEETPAVAERLPPVAERLPIPIFKTARKTPVYERATGTMPRGGMADRRRFDPVEVAPTEQFPSTAGFVKTPFAPAGGPSLRLASEFNMRTAGGIAPSSLEACYGQTEYSRLKSLTVTATDEDDQTVTIPITPGFSHSKRGYTAQASSEGLTDVTVTATPEYAGAAVDTVQLSRVATTLNGKAVYRHIHQITVVYREGGRCYRHRYGVTTYVPRGPGGFGVYSTIEYRERQNATLAFRVDLPRPATRQATVDYATSDGTARAGVDYTETLGTLIFNVGDQVKTVSVPVLRGGSDLTGPNRKTMNLRLSNPDKTHIRDVTGTGVIDTEAFSVYGGDGRYEGGVLEFTVELSYRSARGTVTVDYATSDGSAAAADMDYTPASGTLTFVAGEREKTVEVTVLEDSVDEATETLTLSLSNPEGAGIRAGRESGEGHIFGRGNATDNNSMNQGGQDQLRGAVDTTLSGLALTDGDGKAIALNPIFAPETTSYTATVAHGVTAMTVAPTANDGNAKVEYLDGYDTAIADLDKSTAALDTSLAVGSNTIKVKVKAGNGTATTTYTVTVTRSAAATKSVRSPTGSVRQCGAKLLSTSGIAADAELSVCWDLGYAIPTDKDVVIEGRSRYFWDLPGESFGPWKQVGLGSNFIPCGHPDTECVLSPVETFRGQAFTYEMRMRRGGDVLAISPLAKVQTPNSDSNPLLASLSRAIDINDEESVLDVATGPFLLELVFTDKDLSALTTEAVQGLEAADFEVTNGTVSVLGVWDSGTYKIRVTPTTLGTPVTVRLSANTVKGVGETLNSDGTMSHKRENSASNTVTTRTRAPARNTRAPATEPRAAAAQLTAAFEDVPAEHDGSSAFTLRVAFSEALASGGSGRKLRRALSVTDGKVKWTRRVNQRRDLYRIKIEPSGTAAVRVSLAPAGSCDGDASVCTAGGQKLSNLISTRVEGPPGLSVADAEVDEGPGAALTFRVTLSRIATGTVTVSYATSAGSATARADYTSANGTLSFNPGDTEKTVSVSVLNDDHDEGAETLTLTLSNPSGAYLADATATGTIVNFDPMPKAWLARFGRAVADQVLDAVEGRVGTPRSAGIEATLGGRRIVAPTGAGAPEAPGAEGPAGALSDWLRSALQDDAELGFRSRAIAGRELLANSSFALTGGSASSGFGAVWGRSAFTRFDGREEALSLDGEVESTTLGVDWLAGRATAGVAFSHSRGKGGYRSGAGRSEIEASITGAYPYGRYEASERLSMWGVAGYGEGTLKLTPEGTDPIERGTDLAMAAAGARGVLAKAPESGGPEIAWKSDALVVRTSSAAAHGSGGVKLAASEAEVTRLRLGLEGSWHGIQAGEGTLVPTVEVGVRHDGGDAETGYGADIGAGLVWSDPAQGIEAEVSAHGLLTHDDGGFRKHGFAGSLAWDPDPASDRGPRLRIAQTMGTAASGGMDALLNAQAESIFPEASDDGDDRQQRRLEAGLGYGFGMFGGRYTGVPEFGMVLTDTSREYIHAWRLREERSAGLAFSLDLEGARRESVDSEVAPEHRFGLGFGWQWTGARREDLEFRIEGWRVEAVNDDGASDDRLGARLEARW